MERIDEKLLYNTELIGASCNKVENRINNLIDIIYDACNDSILYDFFDVRGTVILYGKAGVGKTSIARNCMNYAIDKYGVDAYVLRTSEIIVSGLGESVRNLSDELSEFRSLKTGILFIDEIDKLFISRDTTGEVSELKRLLIEFMEFVDTLCVNDQKMVIGCTNVYEQIDMALKRRFAIHEEIVLPENSEKQIFFNMCLKNVGINETINLDEKVLSVFATMDSIKAYFRDIILQGKIGNIIDEIKKL